jgi:hypothetical protein
MAPVAFGATDDSYTATESNSGPRQSVDVRDSYLEEHARTVNRGGGSSTFKALDSQAATVAAYQRDLRETVDAEEWETKREWETQRVVRTARSVASFVRREALMKTRTRNLFDRVDGVVGDVAALAARRGASARLGASADVGGSSQRVGDAARSRRSFDGSSRRRGGKLPPPPMEVKAEARRIVGGMREVSRLDAWEANQRLRKVLHHADCATVTEHVDHDAVNDIAALYTTRADGTLTVDELSTILDGVGHSLSDAEAAFLNGEARAGSSESGASGSVVFSRFLRAVVFTGDGAEQ